MQLGSVPRFEKLVKTRLRDVLQQQEFREFKYIGQTRLGGFFVIRAFELIHQWIDFDLEGCGEIFC